jgi:hypothetical protein
VHVLKLKREVLVPASSCPYGPTFRTFLPIVISGIASIVIVAAFMELYVQAKVSRGERFACGVSAPLDCAAILAGAPRPETAPVYLPPPAAGPSVPECAVTHDVTAIEILGRPRADQPADFMVPVTVYRCPVSETEDRLHWHRAGATGPSQMTISSHARVDYVLAGAYGDLD